MGSKGIPGKNFRPLPDGTTCVLRAVDVALRAGIHQTYVSTDSPSPGVLFFGTSKQFASVLERPSELAEDDTPMVDVVRHALSVIPGPPDQIIVLLQPTQPLRTPEHVRRAIEILRTAPDAESVVSIVELPRTHHPRYALAIDDAELSPWRGDWKLHPKTRQENPPVYRADGTVYAFWRNTLDKHGTIYGDRTRPLIIPAAESCDLDTEDDWTALVQRLTTRKTEGVCQCAEPQPFTRPSGTAICLNPSCGGKIVAPAPRPANP